MKVEKDGFWAVNSQTPSSTCENSQNGPILQKNVCKKFGYNIQVFRFKP